VESEAKFKDEPYEMQATDVEAVAFAAGGGTSAAIPVITEDKEPETDQE
jgi:hypothetical protein